jgi:protein-tyrosine phosphatase
MDSLAGFIDIHSHILPGLDDGPSNYRECLEAARQYEAIGVHCIVATPHSIRGTSWSASPDRILAGIRETSARLDADGISMRILPGMEIALPDLLYGRFPPSDFLSLAETGVFLVEFPMHSFNMPGEKTIFRLPELHPDMRFVIAHPERCGGLVENMDLVERLVEAGMLLQVNIASILGVAGAPAKEASMDLIRRGLVHFLATDSHAGGRRTPPGPEQMSELCELLGNEAVEAGFRVNPLNMLRGENIEPLMPRQVCLTEEAVKEKLLSRMRHKFRRPFFRALKKR